jgi:hypothetical protein
MEYLIKYEANSKMHSCIFLKETEPRKRRGKRVRYADFLCSCGKVFNSIIAAIKYGKCKGCGCRRGKNNARIIHGYYLTSPEEFHIWSGMIKRCTDPKNKRFANYGGRGIKVCPRWMIFDNFLADVGKRPSKKHSLDRYPDNNGDYEPGNFRWATSKEQTRNYSRNVMIEYLGQKKCLMDWCEELGIKYEAISQRIRTLKWDPIRALETPIRKGRYY